MTDEKKKQMMIEYITTTENIEDIAERLGENSIVAREMCEKGMWTMFRGTSRERLSAIVGLTFTRVDEYSVFLQTIKELWDEAVDYKERKMALEMYLAVDKRQVEWLALGKNDA